MSAREGRACDRTRPLAAYFSEYALFKYRVLAGPPGEEGATQTEAEN